MNERMNGPTMSLSMSVDEAVAVSYLYPNCTRAVYTLCHKHNSHAPNECIYVQIKAI